MEMERAGEMVKYIDNGLMKKMIMMLKVETVRQFITDTETSHR